MPTTDVMSTVVMPVFKATPAPKAADAAASSAVADNLPAAKPVEAPAPTVQEVHQAVQQIQKYLAQSVRTLEFRVDDASGVPVVTVRDASSGDVIRQIPNEETLHLAQMLKETHQAQHALVSLTV